MKFEIYLPTREECQEIVKNTETFYCTKHNIMGYDVELYDYRLASFSDFVNNNAWELRGICFIRNDKGVWERNILMNKFFNINESAMEYHIIKNKATNEILFDGPDTDEEYNEMMSKLAPIYKKERYIKSSWMLEDIKHKKIVRIQDKLDGSVISFVKFPNGNILAKSKMSFISPQAIMAQKIFDENINLNKFISAALNDNYIPIFELVSPHNQIVLQYNNTELKLLHMRNKLTGKYLSYSEMQKYINDFELYDILAKEYTNEYYSFEKLLELQKTEENIEGWVITLDDGQMIKIKTAWYFQMHGLTTETIRENLLIRTILEDNIDDVISLIPDGEKKEFIIQTTIKVQQKFNHLIVEYKKLRGLYFNVYNEDKRKFADDYKKHELFGYVMKKIDTSFTEIEEIAEKQIKEFILNNTRKLKDAQKFLKI